MIISLTAMSGLPQHPPFLPAYRNGPAAFLAIPEVQRGFDNIVYVRKRALPESQAPRQYEAARPDSEQL